MSIIYDIFAKNTTLELQRKNTLLLLYLMWWTQAASLIKSRSALDGIPDTPEGNKLINVVIPLLVLALPKTHDAAVEKTVAAQVTTQA